MTDHIDDKHLLGYIHRTLSDGQREDIDHHLATCLICRSRLTEYESLQRRIRNGLSAEIRKMRPAPQKNFAAIRPHLNYSPRSGWIRGTWMADLSIALVTILGFVLFGAVIILMLRNISPSTTDQAALPTKELAQTLEQSAAPPTQPLPMSTTTSPTGIPVETPAMNVEITSPENDSVVTSPTDMSFTVTGDIPDGFKPVVVVRDPLGQLWPWLHIQNLGQGDWFLPGVVLGTNPDCGRSFTLYTIITNEDVPTSRISTLPGGESHSVTVTKQCAETPND